MPHLDIVHRPVVSSVCCRRCQHSNCCNLPVAGQVCRCDSAMQNVQALRTWCDFTRAPPLITLDCQHPVLPQSVCVSSRQRLGRVIIIHRVRRRRPAIRKGRASARCAAPHRSRSSSSTMQQAFGPSAAPSSRAFTHKLFDNKLVALCKPCSTQDCLTSITADKTNARRPAVQPRNWVVEPAYASHSDSPC